jgi:hypothetical protein
MSELYEAVSNMRGLTVALQFFVHDFEATLKEFDASTASI